MILTRPALDLTRYQWSHRHGDITVYGTWWLAEDSGPIPCLVLIPTHKQSWQKATPCVVLLNDAWIWSEEIGDGRTAARTAMAFANALGLDVSNHHNVFRVRSIIVDHIGDLLAIKPMPGDMRSSEVIGEAIVTNRDTGKTVEREVTELV